MIIIKRIDETEEPFTVNSYKTITEFVGNIKYIEK